MSTKGIPGGRARGVMCRIRITPGFVPALHASPALCDARASRARPVLPFALRQVVCFLVLATADLAGAVAAVTATFVEQRALPVKAMELVSCAEAALLLFGVVAVTSLLRGLYFLRFPFWETVRATIGALLVSFAMVVIGLFLLRVAAFTPRSFVLLAVANALVTVPALRMLAILALADGGLWARRTIVVGETQRAAAVAADLESDFALGHAVVGITGPRDAERLARQADEVVVVPDATDAGEIADLVCRLHAACRAVTIVPDLGDLPLGWGSFQFLFDRRRILLTSRNRLREPVNGVVKRAFDVVVSLLLLILALPLMAAIAAAVMLDSRGSPLVRQPRLGRGGRPFVCLKFRTMRRDADETLGEVLQDPARRDEWERYHKLRDDPRVTRLGRLLRVTSLDELPQLINVLLGRMSLVGARPYLPRERDEMGPAADTILATWPGITGLWQVSGRGELTFEDRLWLEAWYVRNWSLWLDVTILLRTLPAVLRRRGAR